MNSNFKATIKLPQAIALYIGAVLGSGILIVPGIAAQIAGPASILAWGGMMILVLPLALCMAFLSQDYPNVGGVSYFVTRAFGDKLGAIIGWFFLMSVPMGAPIAALTGSGYLSMSLGLGENYRIIIACTILVLALVVNYVGMGIAGGVQVAVVISILLVLGISILGSIGSIQADHFKPFMPNGMSSIGKASTILFWCFIGWEAVSHLSEEFVNPKKDVIRATIISAIIVGILYFMTALVTIGIVGDDGISQAPLVVVAHRIFGWAGAIIVGIISLLICMATVIAYIGAASRLAFSLSKNGDAPKVLSYISRKYNTPIGGLVFLAICFVVVISLYSLKIVTLTQLIQLPNTTFILTYLGGCASGVVLLRHNRVKLTISIISLMATGIVFIFAGWAIVYPLVIMVGVIISKVFQSKLKSVQKIYNDKL